MAQRVEISCIEKTDRFNPHERIQTVGGKNTNGSRWQLNQPEAIAGTETGKWTFFVKKGGHPVDVIVATSRYGHKYLKTIADGEQPNNLLSLPGCSL